MNDDVYGTCPQCSVEWIANQEPWMLMVEDCNTKQSKLGQSQSTDWSMLITFGTFSGSCIACRPKIRPDRGSRTRNQPFDFLPAVRGDLRFRPARLLGACGH